MLLQQHRRWGWRRRRRRRRWHLRRRWWGRRCLPLRPSCLQLVAQGAVLGLDGIVLGIAQPHPTILPDEVRVDLVEGVTSKPRVGDQKVLQAGLLPHRAAVVLDEVHDGRLFLGGDQDPLPGHRAVGPLLAGLVPLPIPAVLAHKQAPEGVPDAGPTQRVVVHDLADRVRVRPLRVGEGRLHPDVGAAQVLPGAEGLGVVEEVLVPFGVAVAPDGLDAQEAALDVAVHALAEGSDVAPGVAQVEVEPVVPVVVVGLWQEEEGVGKWLRLAATLTCFRTLLLLARPADGFGRQPPLADEIDKVGARAIEGGRGFGAAGLGAELPLRRRCCLFFTAAAAAAARLRWWWRRRRRWKGGLGRPLSGLADSVLDVVLDPLRRHLLAAELALGKILATLGLAGVRGRPAPALLAATTASTRTRGVGAEGGRGGRGGAALLAGVVRSWRRRRGRGGRWRRW